MAYNKASFNLKKEVNLDVTVEQCKTRWKTLKVFEVDNEGVEFVYSNIDERTLNRASSSTTSIGASASSTGASAPRKNRVRRDSLDTNDGVIKKLALAADKLAGNVG
ncbi:hypothetical protein GIB67_010779 [Kingdonia uniflora]|uniref:Uncharacterized protein n=1 Tax=Kingdonia uniflora TaxID=39325 RepID=A0A7J7L8Y0_9MAGN|nr:hypothetical protein GIB67_010779 [Kingdonia uniflora]